MAVINIDEAKMQIDRKGFLDVDGRPDTGSFFRD